MIRFLLVPAVLLVVVSEVPAKRVAAPPAPVQRALTADVVVVGKVTAIEKEMVEVPGEPGEPAVAYQVAVVKVESPLAGAGTQTHLKVGLLSSNGGPRRGLVVPAPAVGQEGLYFLTKHPSGRFYTYNWMSTPVDSTAEDYKAQVAAVKKALAVVADPLPALKSASAADRAFAAVTLVVKYRTPPAGVEAETATVSAEESRLILKGLADETNWAQAKTAPVPPTQALFRLGLTEQDGWATPPRKPGQPADINALYRTAFVKWLDGPGKDYRISKFVPKK